MNESEILKKFIEWKNKPRVRMAIRGVPPNTFNWFVILTNNPDETKEKIGCKHCKSWLADNFEVGLEAHNLICKELYQNPSDDITLKKYINVNLDIHVFVFLENPKANRLFL